MPLGFEVQGLFNNAMLTFSEPSRGEGYYGVARDHARHHVSVLDIDLEGTADNKSRHKGAAVF